MSHPHKEVIEAYVQGARIKVRNGIYWEVDNNPTFAFDKEYVVDHVLPHQDALLALANGRTIQHSDTETYWEDVGKEGIYKKYIRIKPTTVYVNVYPDYTSHAYVSEELAHQARSISGKTIKVEF